MTKHWSKEFDSKWSGGVYTVIKGFIRQTREQAKQEGIEVAVKKGVFGCVLGLNHCVTGTADCNSQSVIDGYCRFYKPKIESKLKKK